MKVRKRGKHSSGQRQNISRSKERLLSVYHCRLNNYLFAAITATICFVLVTDYEMMSYFRDNYQKQFSLESDEQLSVQRSQMMERLTARDDSIEIDSRPIIYTFFEWVHPFDRDADTEIPDEAEEALIREWKAAWRAFGWEPKVLSLKDARIHPSYTDFYRRINEIPMQNLKGERSVKNQFSFLRWLAVAAVGGGYMCDYNVFPLSHAPKTMDLPYEGNFAIYCEQSGPDTTAAPCFMSGSAKEWTRMAFLLMIHAKENEALEASWSDTLALFHLHNHAATETYTVHDSVFEGRVEFPTNPEKESELICQNMMDKHAIRFPLRLFHSETAVTARPAIIRRFLDSWSKTCKGEASRQRDYIGTNT